MSEPRLLDQESIFIFSLEDDGGDPFARPAPPDWRLLDLSGSLESEEASAVFHPHTNLFLQESVRIFESDRAEELTVIGPGYEVKGRLLWSRLNLVRQVPFLGGQAGGLRLAAVATSLTCPVEWPRVLIWNAVLRERRPKDYQRSVLGEYRVLIGGREYPGRLPEYLEELLPGGERIRTGAATALSYVLAERRTFPGEGRTDRDFIMSDTVNRYFDPFRKFRPFLAGGDVLPIADSLSEYHYREWASSRYALSTYGFSVLAFDESHDGQPVEANRHYMKEWLSSRYYLTAVLALFQRETLLRVSEELSRIGSRSRIPERVRHIREFMLAFTNQTWFNEITGDIQAQGIWEGWRRGLGTERLYNEVREELQELDQFLQDRYNALLNRSILRLTRYSIPLALFGVSDLGFRVVFPWLGVKGVLTDRLALIFSTLISLAVFIWLGSSAEGISPLALGGRAERKAHRP